VGAVPDPAGKGLINKGGLEDRGDQPVDGVLDHTVPEGRGEDPPRLRLMDGKGKIGPHLIGPAVQFCVQGSQLGTEAAFEGEAGPLAPFTAGGIVVGLQQGLFGKGPRKEVAVPFHAQNSRP
jgi:hypothetical protein